LPGDVEFVAAAIVDVVLGDWNGDGAEDVGLVTGLGSNLVSLLSVGSTGVDAGHFSLLPDSMTPVAIAAGDFDVDGDDDVAVGLGFDGYVMMVSQGDGTFTFDAPIDLLSTGRFASMVGGDFDGDGLTDVAGVLVQSGQPDRIGFLKGNGAGLLGPAVVETDLDPSLGAGSLVHLHAGDVNGDGLDDLACGAPSANRTLVLLADGTGRFVAASDPKLVGGAHDTLDLVDLDGDGDLDLLIGDAALFTVRALLNELL
jgi:VCBS repeat protein